MNDYDYRDLVIYKEKYKGEYLYYCFTLKEFFDLEENYNSYSGRLFHPDFFNLKDPRFTDRFYEYDARLEKGPYDEDIKRYSFLKKDPQSRKFLAYVKEGFPGNNLTGEWIPTAYLVKNYAFTIKDEKYTLYRGLSFENKAEYINFIAKCKGGTSLEGFKCDVSFNTVTSWSIKEEVAEKFSKIHSRPNSIILSATFDKKDIFIDLNLYKNGKLIEYTSVLGGTEFEVIVLPGSYNVNVHYISTDDLYLYKDKHGANNNIASEIFALEEPDMQTWGNFDIPIPQYKNLKK